VSLRLRITLLCVALVAVVLTAFAIMVNFLASTRIYASLDDGLEAQANSIIATLPAGTVDETQIRNSRQALETEEAAGLLFQIRDASGSVLYSSFRGSPDVLPPGGSLDEQAVYERKVAQQQLRLLHMPIDSGSRNGGSIEVGRPMKETDEALTEIRGTLIIGGFVALLVTSLPAYFIAGRALDPIREISRIARRVERTSDFSQRLVERPTRDEIGELTATFNDLIRRIEQTLAAHSRFLAEASHELRRPLTILRTNLYILRDPGLPESDRAACLERMSREASAMTSLVGDLLLLNRDRAQSLERAPIDLSRLCGEEAMRMQFAEPAASLQVDVAPNIMVEGDTQRLQQVIRNLLENALNYSPGGGAVMISLKKRSGRARLSVRDFGIGITPDELPRIFDRFYRGAEATRVHHEGMGLGLSIVKYVVEGLGGDIKVESQSQGTVFTVELPASQRSGKRLRDLLPVP
jgi:two-component system, OmpR family, sensor kinase